MHDTAFDAARQFFNVHFQVQFRTILEIGSYDVGGFFSPGKIRDLAPPGAHFVGVDIEEGPNVDIVIGLNEKLPFPDASFDAVIASSVFEHDVAFWITFLEMLRVTSPIGVVYINAPSNGTFHQYPFDNWRFYPDAGIALQKWAVRSDFPVQLIESFVAERKRDIWNDFCAVFSKGPQDPWLGNGFISERIECTNVRRFGHDGIINLRPETEDMVKGNFKYSGPQNPNTASSESVLAQELRLPKNSIDRLKKINQLLRNEIGSDAD